ncbi:MAG: hypothetical protein H6733_05905 [Alphaproteobacteria bacterium]|nr:hypothetical protein [Alphaproteobacteria bacterium]
MRAIFVAVLAAACASPSVDGALPTDGLPVDQAGPPLVLQIPDLYAGDVATFRVSGVVPLDRVYLAVAPGTASPGFCPPILQGACVTLDSPVLVGVAQADATGTATIAATVPVGALGQVVWFQAASVGHGGVVVSSRTLREVYDATCPQVIADFVAEADDVRACVLDTDCGQVLTGTSCGCTRDWVARVGADTTDFYRLLSQAGSCGYGLASTCDCPSTSGFLCDAGTCTWNYVP